MSFFTNKRKRKIFISIFSFTLALVLVVSVCAIYLGDYYRADTESISAFAPMNDVKIKTLDNGTLIFEPENAAAGFIFYPGGKVEHTAYKPLMAACAQQGILCVLVEMPFNLAVLNINAADGIQKLYPQIEHWYMGGHSLGGSMAASYLSAHHSEFDGLIILGSYSTANLSGTELKVLSIYGSEDKIMNKEKYDLNKSNLPSTFSEIILEGGCHAYFGMYGAQDGDGTPTITNEEQIILTAEEIDKMIKAY